MHANTQLSRKESCRKNWLGSWVSGKLSHSDSTTTHTISIVTSERSRRVSISEARQPGSYGTQCIIVKATWRVQDDVLEGPQPGPPARILLAFAFVATTYILFIITVLVLDALNSASTDVALYQVTNREHFGHPLSMTVTGMSRCSSPHSSRIHPNLLSCHSSYHALRLPLPKYTATLPKKLSPCVELALSHLVLNVM